MHIFGNMLPCLFQSTPSVWRETTERVRGHTGTRFQSTPSVWRETLSKLLGSATLAFQSTPSVWRETRSCCCSWRSCSYFNPLPPCGGRHAFIRLFVSGLHFNPLPPCGGRLEEVVDTAIIKLFQSTPSVWRETIDFTTFKGLYGISIHSLRVEGDAFPLPRTASGFHFNPLPPCGGRQLPHRAAYHTRRISIHSLRVEGDDVTYDFDKHCNQFQSTPSVWRETPVSTTGFVKICISIHSLRVEGD